MENVEQNLAGALLATSVPKDLIDHYSDEYSLMNILTANYSSSMSATLLTEVLEEHGVRRQFSANESAFFDFAADGTSSNRWGEDPSSSGEASVRAAMVALTPGAHVFVTQRMPFVRDVLRMFAPDCTAPNITHHGIVHHVPKSPDEPCIVHFWRQGSDPVPSVALCSFRKFLNAESKSSAAGGGARLDDDTVRRRVRRFGVMFYGVAPSSRLPGQAPRSRLYQRRTLPPVQIVANAESALRGGASGFSLGNTCEHLAVQCTLGPAHHASAQLESVFKAVQSLRDGLHRSGVGGRCSASDELASVARASLGSVRDVVAGSAERVGLDPIRLLLRTILDLLHVVGAPEHDVAEGRSAVDSIALALRAQAWHLALLMSPKRLSALELPLASRRAANAASERPNAPGSLVPAIKTSALSRFSSVSSTPAAASSKSLKRIARKKSSSTMLPRAMREMKYPRAMSPFARMHPYITLFQSSPESTWMTANSECPSESKFVRGRYQSGLYKSPASAELSCASYITITSESEMALLVSASK